MRRQNKAIRENCYKLQHRWYWTPVRLKKVFPTLSDRCWRFGRERADVIHGGNVKRWLNFEQ